MTLTNYFPSRLFLALISHVIVTHAIRQNTTVDDSSVIPQYLPSSGWTNGETCSSCGAQPDPQQAFNGTWHDSTFHPSDGSARAIEFSFNVPSTYANTINSVDTTTNMNFIIDESIIGSFTHNPSSSTDYQYNVPIYVNEFLPSGQHHLRMEGAGDRPGLILFDYLVYTSDVDDAPSLSLLTSEIPSSTASSPFDTSLHPLTPSPTTSSPLENPPRKQNIAPIIGGVVGVIVALSLLAGATSFFWKHKMRDRRMTGPDSIKTQEKISNGAAMSIPIPGLNERSYGTTLTPYYDPNLTGQSVPTTKMKSPDDVQNSSHLEESGLLASSSRRPDPPPTSAPSTSDIATLREQLERLMNEVAHLRTMHMQDRNNNPEVESVAPPGYSDSRVLPDPPR